MPAKSPASKSAAAKTAAPAKSAAMELVVQEREPGGELFVEFPPSLMASLDWRDGDDLAWSVEGEAVDGTARAMVSNLSKKAREQASLEAGGQGAPELPLFEVQTLITHRVRYAVRARTAEEAAAAVAAEGTEALEFDQNCLGKMVSDVREVSVEGYLADPGHLGSMQNRLALIHGTAAPKAGSKTGKPRP